MIIPKEIVVGFNKRTHGNYRGVNSEDFFEGGSYLLGFATFKDKGKLRKETSWEGWRDTSIPEQTLANIPLEGFQITEFDRRSSEWFGTGRTMFRIMDPYGFVLEITPANLLAIVSTATIEEGKLIGEFIWAWEGKDQALLSVNSELYKEAVISTSKKNAKTIKPSSLQNGDKFETANEKKYTYIGKCWGIDADYSGSLKNVIRSRQFHILINEQSKIEFVQTIKVINIIENTNVESLDNFIERFNKSKESKTLIMLDEAPANYAPHKCDDLDYGTKPNFISASKINVTDVVETKYEMTDIITKAQCKNHRGYINSIPHVFLKIQGKPDEFYMWTGHTIDKNSYWNKHWNKQDAQKYASVTRVKRTVDTKNNKITFEYIKNDSDTNISRYSYNSTESHISLDTIKQYECVRFEQHNNNIKYILGCRY